MRCLVTGASGYIGRELVPALAASQCTVRAVVYRGAAGSAAQETLTADLATGLSIEALAGVDTVFHLAGLAHGHASAAAYDAVNVEATRRLALQASAAGVRRFIYLSSVKAALVGRAGEPADAYARSKARAETALLDAVGTTGATPADSMEVVIVRPALVYGGAPRAYLRWLERWSRARLPAPPEGGARSMVARADLVRLLLLLREADVDPPLTVTVTDGETYSARRLHAAFCAASGRRPWLPSPPRAAWRGAARVVDTLSGQPSGSTWRRLQGEERYPVSDLEELLGFRPQLSFERALGLSGPAPC